LDFELVYHAEVKEDVARLDERLKRRIKTAIETRLTVAPHQYGKPLRKTLKGFWKLHVGDYRVVFKISGHEVWILGIIHRKDVYEKVEKRAG
jgi:mRNA interferase RelE/StbE